MEIKELKLLRLYGQTKDGYSKDKIYHLKLNIQLLGGTEYWRFRWKKKTKQNNKTQINQK